MMDFKMCEPCGNLVPVVEVAGDFFCEYCFSEYGEELAMPL